jgi:hypothetical protein
MKVDDAKAALAKFLEFNPLSTISPIGEKSGDDASIKAPWGDSSMYLIIPREPAALFDALNNVFLPERFAGIWHRDSKNLEIMYTAFPLEGSQADMDGRKFLFSLGGADYSCEFGLSSQRALDIAKHAIFAGASRTEFRNLPSFQFYGRMKPDDRIPNSKPISFWIRNIEWNEDSIVELARHLNFYLSYYDMDSPVINIHPPKPDIDDGHKPRERYIAGSFPDKISGTTLNSNLLHFWAASRSGDAFRRFLYCYQILEFASFYFVEDQIKRAVKKALITPHVLGQMDSIVIKIIDHVQESKIWEGNKMGALLEELVEPDLIWREIDKNRDYFSKNIEFDGGFILKPLIVDKATRETFNHDWHARFNQTIRSIRNALSHGKEQKMSAVIAPTAQNFGKMRVWTGLISVAAGEVVTYYSATL